MPDELIKDVEIAVESFFLVAQAQELPRLLGMRVDVVASDEDFALRWAGRSRRCT